MRLGRIASPDGVAFVSIEGDVENGALEARAREIAEHPFGTPTFTGRSWPLADVRLLAPILASKVVCMGKNYAAHAAEMGGVEWLVVRGISDYGDAHQKDLDPGWRNHAALAAAAYVRALIENLPAREPRGGAVKGGSGGHE